MAKKNKVVTKIRVNNTAGNRLRRIQTEMRHSERVLDRLLQRHADGKPGGIKKGGGRHKGLLEHIKELKVKL